MKKRLRDLLSARRCRCGHVRVPPHRHISSETKTHCGTCGYNPVDQVWVCPVYRTDWRAWWRDVAHGSR